MNGALLSASTGTMSGADLLALFSHFMLLSVLSVGGALAASPEMHRYMVEEHRWLSHQQFVDGITLAQAAPGPNILFVMLLGWQAGGWLGAAATSVGILLPSSLMTFYANRWRAANHTTRLVRAIRLGLSPIAIGLTGAAGWIIASNNNINFKLMLLTAVTIVVVLRTRLNPLWLIGMGALLGTAGMLA